MTQPTQAELARAVESCEIIRVETDANELTERLETTIYGKFQFRGTVSFTAESPNFELVFEDCDSDDDSDEAAEAMFEAMEHVGRELNDWFEGAASDSCLDHRDSEERWGSLRVGSIRGGW